MISYARRGKELEKIINNVNMKYRLQRLAIIYKVPLPVEITKLGLVPKQSIVDYIGSKGPKGRAVAFDAKETISKTSFPLKNIHQHQLTFLDYYMSTGAEATFLIWFKKIHINSAFWVPCKFILNFIKKKTRKSIPYEQFKKEWLVPLDDYLNLF